jgi:hypothetical protein
MNGLSDTDPYASLKSHLSKTCARNADGPYVCYTCGDAAKFMLLERACTYVCEACYNTQDTLGMNNCYKLQDGLLQGGVPGASYDPVLPACCWNDMLNTVTHTWHGGNVAAALVGKLHFTITSVNGVGVDTVPGRKLLFQELQNVLAWIPIWHDSAWSLCVCCDAKHPRFGHVLSYCREDGRVLCWFP